MLTTAGPTFSTRSVKSGRPCARAGARRGRREQAERQRERGVRQAARRRAAAKTSEVRHGVSRIGTTSKSRTMAEADGVRASRRDSLRAFLRSSAAANILSVAGGTSPTTVTHQSPCRCARVDGGAQVDANIGLAWRSARIRLDEHRHVGQAVGIDRLQHRRRRARRRLARRLDLAADAADRAGSPAPAWRIVQPSASRRVGVSAGRDDAVAVELAHRAAARSRAAAARRSTTSEKADGLEHLAALAEHLGAQQQPGGAVGPQAVAEAVGRRAARAASTFGLVAGDPLAALGAAPRTSSAMPSSPACSSAGNELSMPRCSIIATLARRPERVHDVVVAEHLALPAVERLDALVLVRPSQKCAMRALATVAAAADDERALEVAPAGRLVDAQQPGAHLARRRRRRRRRRRPARTPARRAATTAHATVSESGGAEQHGAAARQRAAASDASRCAGRPTARPAPDVPRELLVRRQVAIEPRVADQLAVGDDAPAARRRRRRAPRPGDRRCRRRRRRRAPASAPARRRRAGRAERPRTVPTTSTKPAATAAGSSPAAGARGGAVPSARAAARAPARPARLRGARAAARRKRRVAAGLGRQVLGAQHVADQVLGVPGRARSSASSRQAAQARAGAGRVELAVGQRRQALRRRRLVSNRRSPSHSPHHLQRRRPRHSAADSPALAFARVRAAAAAAPRSLRARGRSATAPSRSGSSSPRRSLRSSGLRSRAA